MHSMSNEELIQEWLDSLKLENKSDMTINEYKKSLLLMLEMPFFKGKHLLELDRDYITSFRLHRIDVDIVSARTLNKNLSALKNFLNYCLRKEYIPENFFSDIRVKFKNQSLPRPIAVNTVNEILDNKTPLNPKYNNQKLRDLAAAEIAYSGGLRISELHAIKLSDINLSAMQLKVLGKGNNERIVFLGKKSPTNPTFKADDAGADEQSDRGRGAGTLGAGRGRVPAPGPGGGSGARVTERAGRPRRVARRPLVRARAPATPARPAAACAGEGEGT